MNILEFMRPDPSVFALGAGRTETSQALTTLGLGSARPGGCHAMPAERPHDKAGTPVTATHSSARPCSSPSGSSTPLCPAAAHFTCEQTATVTCPRSHSREVAEPESKPKQLTPGPCLQLCHQIVGPCPEHTLDVCPGPRCFPAPPSVPPHQLLASFLLMTNPGWTLTAHGVTSRPFSLALQALQLS